MRLVFENVGGVHQLRVGAASDLAGVDKVDPARWAVTSAPAKDLHVDPALAEVLDTEKRGRIRVAEVIAARDWLMARLAAKDRLTAGTDTLRLDDIDTKGDGAALRKAAEHVIAQIGAKTTELTLEQLRKFRAGYTKLLANGDGIVCAEVIPEEDVAQFVKDIVATTGGSKDASGLTGVGEADLAKFIDKARAFLAWKKKGEEVTVWGEATEAAAKAVRDLDVKIEEFFWHCDLVRQEAHAAGQPRLTADEVRALRTKDAATIEKYLAESPLATPVADGKLAGPVNSVYAERFDAALAVAERVLGVKEPREPLDRTSWRRVKATFAAYETWRAAQPPEKFPAALERYLAGPLVDRLKHHMSVDSAAAKELQDLASLEKLMLLQRWLLEVANNFVNISRVYDPNKSALMERGCLVLDGRRLEFCVDVKDRAAHRKVAEMSLFFLVYAEIRDKESGAAVYTVASPLAAGERGRLRVGKRGIFIDKEGKEWDSEIVDLIENPISLWEAFRAPFRRISTFVSKKIDDLAASQLASHEKSATATAEKPGGMNIQSLLLVGGIAISGATAALAFALQALASLNPLRLVLGIVSIVLVIGGISAFLGWLKLRRRDMSYILEANGWALNVPMNVRRKLAGTFTHVPRLPKGSTIARIPQGRGRRIVLALFLFLMAAVVAFIVWLATRPEGFVASAHAVYSDAAAKVQNVSDGIASIFSLDTPKAEAPKDEKK